MQPQSERQMSGQARAGKGVGGFRYQGAGLRPWTAEGPGGETQNLRDGQKKKNSNLGTLDSTFRARAKASF